MVEIDQILRSNEKYSNDFKYGMLSSSPARKLAVPACMDTRINVENVLGLSVGDAHIIRNAGGIATDDAVQFSYYFTRASWNEKIYCFESYRLRIAQIY